jgi:hypothetical protein
LLLSVSQDEARAIVHRDDLDAIGKPGPQLRELRPDTLDGGERVLPETHDDDAPDDLSPAVQLDEAAPQLRTERDGSDVLDQDRRSLRVDADGDVLHVAHGLEVPEAAHHELGLGHLDEAPADLAVALADGAPDLRDRQVEGLELHGVHGDLVLLDVTADARHLRHALDTDQLVPQVPVLNAAQLLQGVLARLQGVLVDPAHPGGVRSELDARLRRQPSLHARQVLEDARTRPVQVRPVLEDDVDERESEERVTADHARVRHGQHAGRQGVGDLVLHDLRPLAGVFGEDDDLDVRQVGKRVERNGHHRVDPDGDDDQCGRDDEELVVDRVIDDALDHGSSGCAWSGGAGPPDGT